ncbi:DUF6691 family protein [Neotabrizicola sp. sgz301269]|uniref:DUF6691 family protein n=1 Tax=Neotabrizicola sp. sgz301269 TaxID=3276282 RepID=UPI0037702D0F
MRIVLAYLIGLIFGTGIVVGGMANPAKVLNFFDFTGDWDPSLLLVMAGALGVTLVGYGIVLPRARPLLAPAFSLPSTTAIDLRLIGGSALFGIGWGLAGFCPGGALPALGTFEPSVYLFLAAMMAGMVLARALSDRLSRGAARPFA